MCPFSTSGKNFTKPSTKPKPALKIGTIIGECLIKIPVVLNFRQNDLLNGGQGAPIGSFYHKSILDKINKQACIINLGGIANITYITNKNKLWKHIRF